MKFDKLKSIANIILVKTGFKEPVPYKYEGLRTTTEFDIEVKLTESDLAKDIISLFGTDLFTSKFKPRSTIHNAIRMIARKHKVDLNKLHKEIDYLLNSNSYGTMSSGTTLMIPDELLEVYAVKYQMFEYRTTRVPFIEWLDKQLSVEYYESKYYRIDK
ncbi:hypothetical protein HSE3_gp033 [Bacillus phage vB_BceM-HSE3]|nr:hypothetical protein HSE3_gp033 [Bacillus phage vB_BceM-HSE3]